MVALVWEEAGIPPRVLVAGRVEQQGSNMQITRLQDVLLRLPMDVAVIQLRAAEAHVNHAEEGRITLFGPIYFSGVAEGLPLWGRAQSAILEPRQQQADLRGVEWLYAGQHVQMESLQLSQEWRARELHGLQGRPAPAALLAAQAALPSPLLLPAFARADYVRAELKSQHQEVPLHTAEP